MRIVLGLVMLVLLAVTVGAQTANVVELSQADYERAQKAWDTLQKAKADWEDLTKDIDKRYLQIQLVKQGQYMACNDGRCVPSEYMYGFEFSKDFKFIVPKPYTGGSFISPACCGTFQSNGNGSISILAN